MEVFDYNSKKGWHHLNCNGLTRYVNITKCNNQMNGRTIEISEIKNY